MCMCVYIYMYLYIYIYIYYSYDKSVPIVSPWGRELSIEVILNLNIEDLGGLISYIVEKLFIS